MIKAEFYRTNGRIKRVKIHGHSGYSTEGSDIVCAGVSVLAQTAILGLTKVLGINVDYSVGEAEFEFTLPPLDPEIEKQANAVVETMAEGVKDLEKGYGKYVKTEEKLCL
ncbi:MAG: ribosomal-processing cysteine protease Prp [Clostridia bacterium]|nr:ribosomal-processing cysteine protease Prp [Clostridia bacterium]